MKNRVYGVIGIASIMANWNADFSGNPKTLPDQTIFGSDKAIKYPMKKMWESEGKKVVYVKSLKIETKNKEMTLSPRSLKERYEQIFNTEYDKDKKNIKEILTNLMSAVDVKNFGATFAADKGNNIAITGAVQFGQGINKDQKSEVVELSILSPFRGKNRKPEGTSNATEEAKSTSIGTKIITDEAHYFYPFSINPYVYQELVDMDVTDGYTDQDYLNFKKAALNGATYYSSNSKEGCENEFALFVEVLEDTYLPNLSEYITFVREDTINSINIKSELFNDIKDKIKSVEIYYNPTTTKLEYDIDYAKIYNIVTKNEV